jgi:hypothetical protein
MIGQDPETGLVSDWTSMPGADPISWLLAGDDPSVRYFTLTELLGAAPGDAEVVAAQRAIMSYGTRAAHLSRAGWRRSLGGPRPLLHCKVRDTVWQLIILAALGADGANERQPREEEWRRPA